jgi:hypothetical protein
MGAQTAVGTRSTAQSAVARIAAGALILGGVALILGSLMTWAKITVPIAGTLTRTGIDSGADAVFCIVVGAVSCLVGLRTLLLGGPAPEAATERAVVGLVGVLGVICVAFAGFAAKHVEDRLGSLLHHIPGFARSFVSGEVGAGIWVVGAGGAVIALAALAQVLASAPARR